ncbi:LysR family transcriptional regulator [Nesterenkonia sp. HG001]|uniref:LysR family transcriptional regulator n=1 Tax=Nesterenkonia sp. HG001 TaxID=2983207 RepID=UPI002AC48FC0|nr:LysR substrate-binding domain-containing protein [Nesterenkonia sp. HG001]MDZ5077144.1 LysR substrate-binding domain-containing protein [Nesterenkonia sp. HG001]
MELSLRRLRMLRELHRRGTVTGVAASLHYSPSAVSQQLAQLEREVGASLFERLGRRIRLTELGVLLTEHADEILGAVERAEMALERAQDGVVSRLKAGVWASVASGLLPMALTRLAQEHPGIEVRTTELAPEDTANAVLDGALDFSFVIEYSDYAIPWDPALAREVIAVERLHAAVAAGTCPESPVSLAAFAEQPWVLAGPTSHFGRAIRLACRRHGFEPRIVHQVEEQATALAMVSGGLGVTLVSDLVLNTVPGGVEVIPLTEPVLRTVSIAHRSAHPTRRPLELVIDAVRAAAAARGLAAGSALP